MESNRLKQTFLTIFILAAITLAVLPFFTALTDVFTRLIMKVAAYRTLQNVIVPYEIKLIGMLINLLGVKAAVGGSFVELQVGGREEVIYLAWNCIGWQTFLLFAVTLITGLSGGFTLVSKLEAFIFGLLGTYLVNIFRITMVVIVYHFLSRPLGIVFHDYFSLLITLGWLFVFWWFSYSFVLEERQPSVEKETIKVRVSPRT